MYILIVKENIEDEEAAQSLFFDFKTKEEALEFVKLILTISNYTVEIIPPFEKK